MTITVRQHHEKPKRPLTAYNIFFREERQRLLETLPVCTNVKSKKAHGKISFPDLARKISRAWKDISPASKVYYCELACQDKVRYYREMEEWRVAERNRGVATEDEVEDKSSMAQEVASSIEPISTSMPRPDVYGVSFGSDHEDRTIFEEVPTTFDEDLVMFNSVESSGANFSTHVATTEDLMGRVDLAIFAWGRPLPHQVIPFHE